jgi:hypothetical protein
MTRSRYALGPQDTPKSELAVPVRVPSATQQGVAAVSGERKSGLKQGQLSITIRPFFEHGEKEGTRGQPIISWQPHAPEGRGQAGPSAPLVPRLMIQLVGCSQKSWRRSRNCPEHRTLAL